MTKRLLLWSVLSGVAALAACRPAPVRMPVQVARAAPSPRVVVPSPPRAIHIIGTGYVRGATAGTSIDERWPSFRKMVCYQGVCNGTERAIASCREFFDAVAAGFEEPGPEIDRGIVPVRCRIDYWMERAKPSPASFLADFVLSPVTLRELPVSFTCTASTDSIELLDDAVKKGKTWGELHEKDRVRAYAEGVEFEDEVFQASVAPLATADFDGDGIEDLLVQLYCSAAGGGSFHYATIHVLTRQAAGAPLREAPLVWP